MPPPWFKNCCGRINAPMPTFGFKAELEAGVDPLKGDPPEIERQRRPRAGKSALVGRGRQRSGLVLLRRTLSTVEAIVSGAEVVWLGDPNAGSAWVRKLLVA